MHCISAVITFSPPLGKHTWTIAQADDWIQVELEFINLVSQFDPREYARLEDERSHARHAEEHAELQKQLERTAKSCWIAVYAARDILIAEAAIAKLRRTGTTTEEIQALLIKQQTMLEEMLYRHKADIVGASANSAEQLETSLWTTTNSSVFGFQTRRDTVSALQSQVESLKALQTADEKCLRERLLEHVEQILSDKSVSAALRHLDKCLNMLERSEWFDSV